MSGSRSQAAARAMELARLEGRDYTLWLAGPDRWVATSTHPYDQLISGFYAKVTPSGEWSGPGADRLCGCEAPQ